MFWENSRNLSTDMHGEGSLLFQAGGNSREPLGIEESGLFLAQSKEKQERVLVFKDLQL